MTQNKTEGQHVEGAVETAVHSVPEGYPADEVGVDAVSGSLPTIKVTMADMPKAEPGHKIAKAMEGKVFEPNAALRNKLGRGPGLQDAEAMNPGVWHDSNEMASGEAAADKIEQDAARAHDRAKERAKALRAGKPDPYPNG